MPRLPFACMNWSPAAVLVQQDRYGSEQDHDVCPEATLRDVPNVQRDPLLVGTFAATADLPQPSKARPRSHVDENLVSVTRDLLFDDRTGSDEAHLSSEYVKELRQFIEAGSPHITSERGDARIVPKLLRLDPFPSCVGAL